MQQSTQWGVPVISEVINECSKAHSGGVPVISEVINECSKAHSGVSL